MIIRVTIHLLWLSILATAGPILIQVASNAILYVMGYPWRDTYWSGYEHILYDYGPMRFSYHYCMYSLIPAILGVCMLMLVACWPNSVNTWERRFSLIMGFLSILPGLLAAQRLFDHISWLFL